MSNETKTNETKHTTHASTPAPATNGHNPAAAAIAATQAAVLTNADGKPLSPKNKKVRGIADDVTTTWVDLNLSAEDNTILQRAAKHRGTQVAGGLKVCDLVRPILDAAIKAHWAEIVADSEKYVPASGGGTAKPAKKLTEMTTAELVATQARAEKMVATAMDRAKKAGELAAKLLAQAAAKRDA